MKTVIKSKTVVKEEIFVAEDGTEFNDEYKCEIYEKYYKCNILELVKDYIIFDEKAKERIVENRTPCFGYALCLKPLPSDVIDYIRMYIRDFHGAKDLVPFCGEYEEEVLYYCNYVNDANGTYGWNGWESIGTEYEIKNQIKRKERQLEIARSLLQNNENGAQ